MFPQLVSDCQPENGNFGFHLFGNMEELLPVLSRPRKSRSKVCHVCLVVSQVEISLLPVGEPPSWLWFSENTSV